MSTNCTNNGGLIDNNSLGVLTTLGFDILMAVILSGVWLILRKYRGDKKTVGTEIQRHASAATNALFLEDTVVEAKFIKIPAKEHSEAPSASTDRISDLFGKLVKR